VVSPSGQDEATAMVTRPVSSPGRGANVVVADISVVDDLPDSVPVTASELAAVETYLGSLIDQLLTDAKASGSTAKTARSFNEGTRPGLPALDRE
jgi:hypothetical protein